MGTAPAMFTKAYLMAKMHAYGLCSYYDRQRLKCSLTS